MARGGVEGSEDLTALDQLGDLLPVLGHDELKGVGVVVEGDSQVAVLALQCLQLLALPLDRQDQLGSRVHLRVQPRQLAHLLLVLLASPRDIIMMTVMKEKERDREKE